MKKKDPALIATFLLVVMWVLIVYVRSLLFRPYEVMWFVGIVIGGALMFGAGYEFAKSRFKR